MVVASVWRGMARRGRDSEGGSLACGPRAAWRLFSVSSSLSLTWIPCCSSSLLSVLVLASSSSSISQDGGAKTALTIYPSTWWGSKRTDNLVRRLVSFVRSPLGAASVESTILPLAFRRISVRLLPHQVSISSVLLIFLSPLLLLATCDSRRARLPDAILFYG